MANITLNIEGDLNIYVSEEDGQPDSLYLDGMDGVPETLRIHLEADGEDDESKAEVIYAIPGAAAISMTLYEALTLALNSGGADSLELMPVSGIFIAFNSDDVIIDQSGDCYLAGPGIIFALEDGDIVSLDGKTFVSGMYSEKTGKSYSAYLVLTDDGQKSSYALEFDREKTGA